MEIVVTGRQIKVSDQFRQALEEKLAKVEQLAPRTQRCEVVLSHETRRGAPAGSERLEITCYGKGTVVRAESYAEDKFAALDLVMDRLTERLRRMGDRRKVARRRGGAPDLEHAVAGLDVATMGEDASLRSAQEGDVDEASSQGRIAAEGDSPIVVREKEHTSEPMTLEQAISAMEAVGHDFFLFHDSELDRPSVVYKRRGWEYGVLHLETPAPAAQA